VLTSRAMTWIHRVSHRPLSDYVEYLWMVDGYFEPRAELVLPTGSMTLVIDLDVEQADGIRIWGARSRPLVLGTSKPLRLMAAHFKPGGAQRFIEVFRNEVDLPPKVFARLVRFQHAVDRITTGTPIDWADLAVASGYFDQPHFIHDFREFSSVSPSAYLRQRSSRNHVRAAN
jgi:hypothetical protein